MARQETDRGFAWVILAASFLNWMLVSGTIRTFGILYAELLDTFDTGAGNTAFVGSLTMFIMSISGLASGFISVHYSFRLCAIVGGIFSGLGMITSSFTTNLEMLFITYSCLIGTGIGLSSTSTMTIINFYFEKKRAFAVSLMTASMGLASLVYPILYRTLIDKYGIHGAMLILGGLLLNICVGGSLFRQPLCFTRAKITNGETMSEQTTSKQAIHVSSIAHKLRHTLQSYVQLFKNKFFVICCVAISCSLTGYSSNFVILPPHIENQGFSKTDAVIVISTIGGTELVVRLFSGCILDKKLVTVQSMFIGSMFCGGIFAIALTFFTDRAVNIIYGITVGIFPGNFHYLRPLLLVSILGLKSLPTSLPLASLMSNLTILIGHPLMGWLEDWTGDWRASFYTMAALFFLSSISVIIDRQLWKAQANQTQEAKSTDDIELEIHSNYNPNQNLDTTEKDSQATETFAMTENTDNHEQTFTKCSALTNDTENNEQTSTETSSMIKNTDS